MYTTLPYYTLLPHPGYTLLNTTLTGSAGLVTGGPEVATVTKAGSGLGCPESFSLREESGPVWPRVVPLPRGESPGLPLP